MLDFAENWRFETHRRNVVIMRMIIGPPLTPLNSHKDDAGHPSA